MAKVVKTKHGTYVQSSDGWVNQKNNEVETVHAGSIEQVFASEEEAAKAGHFVRAKTITPEKK